MFSARRKPKRIARDESEHTANEVEGMSERSISQLCICSDIISQLAER